MAAARTRNSGIAAATHLAGKIIALFTIAALLFILIGSTHADTLTMRSLSLDNHLPTHADSYKISFTINNPANVGSLDLLFCSNSPLIDDSCTAPTGLDISGATLALSNGLIDMSIQSATANHMVLTRPSTPIAAPLTVIFSLQNVVNPSNEGSYYLRLGTYASTDATGPSISFGGMVFVITDTFKVSAQVPPYLTFCTGVEISSFDCASATGSYLNLGILTPNKANSGQSQMMVATNGQSGYSIWDSGTTFTAGNSVITAMTANDVSRPGTNQFGINLRKNVDPAVGEDPVGPGVGTPEANYNIADQYRFISGDLLASALQATDYRRFTVAYVVNASASQPSGVYSSTLTYICLANF